MTDNGDVLVRVETEAIKGIGNASEEQLAAQAAAAKDCLEPVDYHSARGTCIDERPRAGTKSDSTKVETRPSVPGGPDVYGMAIMELTGQVPASMTSGKGVLTESKKRINDAGIRSGGHAGCAANGGFADWMRAIAYDPETVSGYVKKEVGADGFDPTVMAEVSDNAKTAIESGRYDEWSEDILVDVLGDEAGEAIEILQPGPHQAATLVRQKDRNYTVHQTKLAGMSSCGVGSFVNDDRYAAEIEAAITSGPDAARLTVLARYAREAILAAVAGAVPNEVLYQIDMGSAA